MAQIKIDKKIDKKQAVTGAAEKKSGGKKLILIIGLALVAAVFAGVVVFFGGGGKGYAIVDANNGVVKIPVSEIGQDAKFYTYKSGGKDINFFVLKSSDGEIRAAFDACDVCYREKKGYTQRGDVMVCGNCGMAFPSAGINLVSGGCNPAPLERFIEGGYLVLSAAEIERGGFFF